MAIKYEAKKQKSSFADSTKKLAAQVNTRVEAKKQKSSNAPDFAKISASVKAPKAPTKSDLLNQLMPKTAKKR